uniref:Protein XRI1-like n=1 Tax=Physcomitrium patens TaxID=3218 RepID=A0A7I4CF57_PHYPA
MEVNAFDELVPIDDQINESDDSACWLWRDDAFKLDSESNIAMVKSFWDDLTQNDEEIFASTPPIENEKRLSSLYFSLESDNASSTSYSAENCGRIKRRKMLHFSCTSKEPVPVSSLEFESASANKSPFASCVNLLDPEADEFLVPVPSLSSNFWCSKDEVGNGADDKWLSKREEPHRPPEKEKVVMQTTSRTEGSGWRSSPLTRFRVQATPVAYPFNLVKPNIAHGDVTLSDINQRIKSTSPNPTRYQTSRGEQKSLAQSGLGLSGKAVVECTKIHTEGNGTITIMKTRG